MSRQEGTMVYSVPRTELVAHLTARQEYHVKRSEALMAEAEREDQRAQEQLDAADSVTDRLDIKSTSNYANVVSTRDQLRTRARHHVKRAAFFRWAVAHVPQTISDFELVVHELSSLEFFPD